MQVIYYWIIESKRIGLRVTQSRITVCKLGKDLFNDRKFGCCLATGLIKIDPDLWIEYPGERRDTIAHELLHRYCYIHYGKEGWTDKSVAFKYYKAKLNLH